MTPYVESSQNSKRDELTDNSSAYGSICQLPINNYDSNNPI